MYNIGYNFIEYPEHSIKICRNIVYANCSYFALLNRQHVAKFPQVSFYVS
jgi:hypothetical protein